MEQLSYRFPAMLSKSGDEQDGRIPITIIPNQPTKDRQNDKILLKAFDQDCVEGFLHDGVIDYDHISVLGKSPIERARAIIGQPESLFVDVKKSVPVCEAFLFADNPYVKESVMPALKSGSKVFGASLGGRVLRKSAGTDDDDKSPLTVISKITLKHIAITPLQKAVHQGTVVQLRKSEEDEAADMCFDTFESFIKSFEDADIMVKALEAGSLTDTAAMTGGQIIQAQSLEGSQPIDYAKIKAALPFLIEDMLSGRIMGFKAFVESLVRKGFTETEAVKTVKLLASNGAKIVKLIL